ncbi:helix-turn-helix domain-containing protein, partial [Endothiovibrio diazotrophicus]
MNRKPDSDGWARLRFAIIGPLLAAPPDNGELASALKTLAARQWRHPLHGHAIQFSVPTLERWYYRARHAADPVAALRPRRREDAGLARRLSARQIETLSALYREHPDWTVQLHYDNLCALAEEEPALGRIPSYSTIRRHFRAQ